MTENDGPAGTVVTVRESGVAYVELRNPGRRNALTRQMFVLLDQQLREAAAAADVNVIVIHSDGPAFCSGLDLTELSAERERGDAIEDLNRILGTSASVCGLIAESRKPVIVAVQGAAVGIGMLIFLACDLGFMATGARLLLPDALLGAGYFGPLLSRLLGPRRAKSLLLRPGTFVISADDAYQWGLAAALHPPERLRQEVRAYAAALAGLPAGWLQLQKTGADHPAAALSVRDAIRAGAHLDAIAHSSRFAREARPTVPSHGRGE
jgi:2-(1,2-epoxy-1,2-dihydrophenyl)acetyl-CoA isomerase